MTPSGLAQTHDAAFGGKGWPAADFAGYLADPNILIHGDVRCFGVFRCVGPEAEVLTLATDPSVQGAGRATRMLRAALAALATRGVQEVFLEVAEDNSPARALYARTGFKQFASRTAYYDNQTAAICMKALLSKG